MSYVVLARKYRPRSFDQMVGQEHVVRALSNALEQRRLHHAYLFTGTRGVGKTTVSRILAKSLNCVGPDGSGGITATPCGVCSTCTEIDADRYIDYIELDAASNRGIDEIRDLLERAAYKPSIGRFKVFMIDEAHQLTKESFNALLKTLEEPPEYLKFVLATTDPEKMLPTVLSRCLQFNLRPMAPEVVHQHLQQVLQAEGVTCDDKALRLLARAARGSMRDALSLADQAIAYGSGRVETDGVRAMLGSVDRDHAARLVLALAARDGAALLKSIDALREHGLSAAGTLEEMAALLQQMAIEQAVPGTLDDADPDTPTTRRLAARLPADETQLLYSIVLHGRGELHLASDEYAALTMVLLRMLAFAPDSPARSEQALPDLPQAPSVAVPTARAGPEPAGEPAHSAQTAPEAAPQTPPLRAAMPEPPAWLDEAPPDDEEIALAGPAGTGQAEPARGAPAAKSNGAAVSLQATALGERWAEAVAQLNASQAVSALARELAMQAELLAVDEAPDTGGAACWRLRVERDSLRASAPVDKLQAALVQTLGLPLRLDVQAGVAQDSPALREQAAAQRRQQRAVQVIQDDPLVQELLASVKTARIVPGSIKPRL